MFPACPEGLLGDLALGDALLQRPVGGRQVSSAPLQPLMQLAQLRFGRERGMVGVLDRGDGLCKKNLRVLDDPSPAAERFQCGERCLMNPGYVQGLESDGHGLASQSPRRLEAGARALFQVFSQRPRISLRQPHQVLFHPNSRAATKAVPVVVPPPKVLTFRRQDPNRIQILPHCSKLSIGEVPDARDPLISNAQWRSAVGSIFTGGDTPYW